MILNTGKSRPGTPSTNSCRLHCRCIHGQLRLTPIQPPFVTGNESILWFMYIGCILAIACCREWRKGIWEAKGPWFFIHWHFRLLRSFGLNTWQNGYDVIQSRMLLHLFVFLGHANQYLSMRKSLVKLYPWQGERLTLVITKVDPFASCKKECTFWHIAWCNLFERPGNHVLIASKARSICVFTFVKTNDH